MVIYHIEENRVILSLKTHLPGCDDILTILVKTVIHSYSKPVPLLINNYFAMGSFPG